MTGHRPVRSEDVRAFWEAHPVAAAANPNALGTREYFEHYDRLREANESVEFSSRLHEYAAFAGRRVLDVGCGNGYVVGRYARAGAEAYGVDITTAAVELSRRRLEFEGRRAHFARASAENLPFGDATFDCVSSMGVLHHVPDTERAVGEIRRVLRPGGRLIVMFYHRDSALRRVRFPIEARLSGKTVEQLVDEVDGVGNPKGDVYSRRQLRRLLAGFSEVEIEVGLLQPWMVAHRGSRFIPRRVLKPFERWLGWFLYAKAVR